MQARPALMRAGLVGAGLVAGVPVGAGLVAGVPVVWAESAAQAGAPSDAAAAPVPAGIAWTPPPADLAWVLSTRRTAATGAAAAESQTMVVSAVGDGLVTVDALEPGQATVTAVLDRGLVPRAVHVSGAGQRASLTYDYDRAALHALWPLALGRAADLQVTERVEGGPTFRYRLTLFVAAVEPLTVDGRSYDTVVIEVERWQGEDLVARSRQWFSPALSTVLAHEVTFLPPGQAPTTTRSDVIRLGTRPRAQ